MRIVSLHTYTHTLNNNNSKKKKKKKQESVFILSLLFALEGKHFQFLSLVQLSKPAPYLTPSPFFFMCYFGSTVMENTHVHLALFQQSQQQQTEKREGENNSNCFFIFFSLTRPWKKKRA